MSGAVRRRITAVCTAAFVLMGATVSLGQTARPRGQLRYDPETKDWIEAAPAETGTPEGDLQIARDLLARRKYASARRAFALWRKEHPDSDLWPEALFAAADVEVYATAERRRNDLWRAYEWYEEIINGWAGTELADRAIRREIVVCEMFLFRGGKRRVFKGLLHVSAQEEALEGLNRIIDQHAPGTPLAEQALRMAADYHFGRGEFEESERAYARLARDFPRGQYERLALERAAASVLASFAGIEHDDAPLLEAEERYEQYAERFPKAAEEQGVPQTLEGIRNSRAQKEFTIGKYYERARRPSAAAYYYHYVRAAWPETIWAAQAGGRLEALGFEPPPDDSGIPPPLEPTGAMQPEEDAQSGIDPQPPSPPADVPP